MGTHNMNSFTKLITLGLIMAVVCYSAEIDDGAVVPEETAPEAVALAERTQRFNFAKAWARGLKRGKAKAKERAKEKKAKRKHRECIAQVTPKKAEIRKHVRKLSTDAMCKDKLDYCCKFARFSRLRMDESNECGYKLEKGKDGRTKWVKASMYNSFMPRFNRERCPVSCRQDDTDGNPCGKDVKQWNLEEPVWR